MSSRAPKSETPTTLTSNSSSASSSSSTACELGSASQRFEKILKKHAPPLVHAESGKGKRAKALMWRIFKK
jgi:hypothetical protein